MQRFCDRSTDCAHEGSVLHDRDGLADIDLGGQLDVPGEAARATADALRRHPANTGLPTADAASAIVAPLGEGRTMLSPGFAFRNVPGESE